MKNRSKSQQRGGDYSAVQYYGAEHLDKRAHNSLAWPKAGNMYSADSR